MQTLPTELLIRLAASPREWLAIARVCRDFAARLANAITSTVVDRVSYRTVTIGAREYFGCYGWIYVDAPPSPPYDYVHSNSLTEYGDVEDLIIHCRNDNEYHDDVAMVIKSPDTIYLAIIFRLPIRILSIVPTIKLSSARGRTAFTPAEVIIKCMRSYTNAITPDTPDKIVSFDGTVAGRCVQYPRRKVIEFTDGEKLGVGEEAIITVRNSVIRCTMPAEELLRRLPQLRGYVYLAKEVINCGGD